MPFALRCSKGHEQGVFDERDEAARAIKEPEYRRCEVCGRPRRVIEIEGMAQVATPLRKIPEHFDPSMGCVVKGRRHHARIQRERGLQDWQPARGGKEMPHFSRMRREGLM